MLWRPGSSWGLGTLLKGTSVVVLRVERVLYIHSPHLQFLTALDLNSQLSIPLAMTSLSFIDLFSHLADAFIQSDLQMWTL